MPRPGRSAETSDGKSAYDRRVARLLRTIEIAEATLERARDLPDKERQAQLAWGRQLAHLATKPTSPKLRTLKSLEFLEQGLLGYWNEASGAHVDGFWRALADRGVDFQRRDLVREALDRRRIKSIHEYEAVTDALVAGMPRGALTPAEVAELKRMIGSYERKQAKQR